MLILNKCIGGGYITRAKAMPKESIPPRKNGWTYRNIRINGTPVKVYWNVIYKVFPVYYFVFQDKGYRAPAYLDPNQTETNACFELDEEYARYEVVSTEPNSTGFDELSLMNFQKDVNAWLAPVLQIVKQDNIKDICGFDLQLCDTSYAVVTQVVSTDAFIDLIIKKVNKHFGSAKVVFNNTSRHFNLWKG